MKKQTALITGISGFAGSHLAEYLLSQKTYEVVGTFLTKNSLKNVSHIKEGTRLVEVNLEDKTKTEEVIKEFKPDLIFHLAALASPANSVKYPRETIISNINIELNLLEAVRSNANQHAKILIISSADVYGKVGKKNLPINEETPLRPINPYAVSKIAQDFLGLQYFLAFKLHIVRARPFNHIGPRQGVGFVVADFAKKIADIEKGKTKPTLPVGNLEVRRDFTDVRDMVSAYHLLLEKGKLGDVYNIGSGVSYKISEILNLLLSLSKVNIEVKKDPSLFRTGDAPELVCDSTKFRALTHWKPSIPLKKTLKDTLDYWRNID